MQFSPIELKEKLLKALDEDNNVVDMLAVLEIISILEKYPITREALEQTRIGKHVNELRKKTNSKDLAKRAKNLVRRWQHLVSSSTQSNTVNGDGIANRLGANPPSGIPPHLQNAGGNSKPASPISRPGTPSSGKSNLSPASIHNSGTATPVSRPGTPSGGHVQSKVSPKLSVGRPLVPGSKPESPALNSLSSTNYIGRRLSPTEGHASNRNCVVHRSSTPTEGLGKTNVANKRKRRLDDSGIPNKKVAGQEENNHEGAQLNHRQSKAKPMVNGVRSDSPHLDTSQKALHTSNTHEANKIPPSTRDSPSLNECDVKCNSKAGLARRNTTLPSNTEICDNINRAVCDNSLGSVASDRSDKNKFERTPSSGSIHTLKVKTTDQLIKELYARGDLRLTASETVTKIALNQIEKEEDMYDISIVPPEAKPRPRRKPGSSHIPPSTPNENLSKTKSEMVQKFLQSSISPSSSELALAGLMDKDDEPLSSKTSSRVFLANLAKSVASPLFNDSVHQNARQDDDPDGGLDFHRSRVMGKDSLVNGTRPNDTDISLKTDPWSFLPPLDLNSVSLEDDDYTPPVVVEPDEFSVDRLHNEHWFGVNGQLDSENSWHDWTATYTMPSYNSEPLHLLPYINIDD